MIRTLAVLLAFSLLSACNSPYDAKHVHVSIVNALRASDRALVTGCNTVVERANYSPHQAIFIEDAAISQGFGYIRINNHLFRVALLKGSTDGFHSLRSFADPGGSLSVVESFDIGTKHLDTGSTELTGELTVTYDGVTETIPFGGGTAGC